MGFRVPRRLGFRVQPRRLGVQGSTQAFGVQGPQAFGVQGLGVMVWGSGFGVQGSGFGVEPEPQAFQRLSMRSPDDPPDTLPRSCKGGGLGRRG